MASEFEGKVVVVTGGSRGIGRSIALAFSGAGAEVVLAAASEPNLQKTAAEIVAALNRHQRFIRGRVAPELDLKFAPEIRFHVDATFEQFGKIDALLKSERVQRDLHHDDEGSSEDEGDR